MRCSTSGRLTPAAATRINTSPGLGCGTGRVPVLSTSGFPGWVISTARMVFGRVMGSAPNALRHLQHQAELSPLVVGGELVAVVGAGEPALRGEAQVLQRHVFRRGFDAAPEVVLFLQLRHLGADEAEHDRL